MQLIWNSDFNEIVNQKEGEDDRISSCFRLPSCAPHLLAVKFQSTIITALELPNVYFLGP